MRALAQALDTALRRAAARGGDAAAQHVHAASLVHARPFYGFHVGARLFLRLTLLDPSEVTRAAALLSAGALLGRAFAVYESHVPFMLQVMMDLNIAGMGLVSAARVTFRGPLPAAACAHRRVRAVRGAPDADGREALAFEAAQGAESAQLMVTPTAIQVRCARVLSFAFPFACVSHTRVARSCGRPPACRRRKPGAPPPAPLLPMRA